MSIIHLQELTVYQNQHLVLDSLSLTVNEGEVFALLGANGAGKTTLLNTMLGFIKPRDGRIRIAQVDVVQQPETVCQYIAYVPENVALYTDLSGLENFDYLMALSGQTITIQARDHVLDMVGLTVTAQSKRVSDYSKGMRQKLAIAIAMSRNVPILLLDEPTSGLDPQATQEFHQLLLTLKDKSMTTFMVTHDILGAMDCADTIGFLKNGKVSTVTPTKDTDALQVYQQFSKESSI